MTWIVFFLTKYVRLLYPTQSETICISPIVKSTFFKKNKMPNLQLVNNKFFKISFM